MEKNEKAYRPILSLRFLSFAAWDKPESACSVATSEQTTDEAGFGMEGLDELEKGFVFLFFMQGFPENRKTSFRKAASEPGASKRSRPKGFSA